VQQFRLPDETLLASVFLCDYSTHNAEHNVYTSTHARQDDYKYPIHVVSNRRKEKLPLPLK